MKKWWLPLIWLWCAPLCAQVPHLNTISPNSGLDTGGQSVTLTGTNLSGSPTVYFGTYTGTITGLSSTAITVTSPAVSGDGVYSVYVASGFYNSNSLNYTYTGQTATFTNTATETATQTPTQTATVTSTNTATNTATQTCTKTATNTATNTGIFTSTFTNTATQTATNTCTNTATKTATQTCTATATNTATNIPNTSISLIFTVVSPTPTPITTPVPGYVDDLRIIGINNFSATAGNITVFLGNQMVFQWPYMSVNSPIGGFILRGDGVNNWQVLGPPQAGTSIVFNASVQLRGANTPAPIY